jgi:hypothetical protein
MELEIASSLTLNDLATGEELATEFAARARAAWARLVRTEKTPSKKPGCRKALAALWRLE